MTKKELDILYQECRKKGTITTEFKQGMEIYQKECKDVKDSIYQYLRMFINKDNKDYWDYVKDCGENAIKHDPGDYRDFSDWFKGSIFENESPKGIEDYLGNLYNRGKFNDFIGEIEFDQFANTLDKEIRLNLCHPGKGTLWEYDTVCVSVG